MELAAAAKQVARAAAAKSKLTKEKIAAINRLADTTIMTTDTSNLSDTARTYIEIQQKLILEKLQSDASGGHFDAGDGEDNDEDEVVSDKGVEFLDSEEDWAIELKWLAQHKMSLKQIPKLVKEK